MGSPEHIRSSVKWDQGDTSDVRKDESKDVEEWEGDDKRKHRSSRSYKSGNGEDAEAVDNSGSRRSTGERNETRKRSAGSSKMGSDEDDHEVKKETRSKQIKKKHEESALQKLSNWYQDGEADHKHESGNREHDRDDENGRKKLTSKLSEYEGSQSRTKVKDERLHDGEHEKRHERDPRSERKESSRDKSRGPSDQGRIQRRRWDESAATRNTEDSDYVEKSKARIGRSSDPKHPTCENSLTAKIETGDSKSRISDSTTDKCAKSHDNEDRQVDSEKSNMKIISEAPEGDNNGSPLSCEKFSVKEKLEEHRVQRIPTGQDVSGSNEMSVNIEEDANTWMRDKTRGDNRSRSPERNARGHHELENEMEYESSSTFRRYSDDRSKGREDGWNDRNRDRESSRDNWKRRISTTTNKDIKDTETDHLRGREWELHRRGRERVDNERPQGRIGGRKDGNRTGAVKTSSNYGISNENYDVIEIQTKPFDYGRDVPRSNFARGSETGPQSDSKPPPNVEEYAHQRDNRTRNVNSYGSAQLGEDLNDRFMDGGPSSQDQNSWKDDIDFQSGKARGQKSGGQSSSSGSQPPHGNQEVGSLSRVVPQGIRGNRFGRGGRVRPTGRDNQHIAVPMPIMGSPFGLGMPPPGAMQPLTPNMSPGPPIPPGVFIPPFSPPVVWPGARGADMNMLAVPPGLSQVPPGPSGPRFSPNMGNPPNHAMLFNQPGPGMGGPPNISGSSFNAMVPMGREHPQDKPTGGWVPLRSNAHTGKAPSRGEQNDYSQNFVDTGMRPQNYIRELELTSVVEDYPKLRELIQKKDEIVSKSATAPVYYKCDLREQVLSPEFFGTKFDVILVDPPWEEYVHRAPGVTDNMEYWTFEEIMNLKIEAIADTPSFIFLWVGDGVGLEQGRQCLKKWGFRRCEDICWVKTNKTNATPGLRHDSRTLFQRSKEHCLMGIKGTVRRSTDGHIIHANIDTDVIIAEEPPYGSTAKPEDMYRIIEHFSLGRRRLELFGEDHNIRSGWLTVGKDLSSSNFNSEAYIRNFADKDGRIWQGGGGRNPPPEAGHLVITTPDIESLRPKSPMKNQHQMQQQQSNSISLTNANSGSKRPTDYSPQNHYLAGINQEASGSSNIPAPSPWSSQMEGFKGREGGNMGLDDRVFDMYGYNAPFSQATGDYLDYESHRGLNM